MATKRKAESAQGSVTNVNSEVTNFLLELADYEKNVNRHVHKFNAYRKAAHVIAKHPVRLTTGAEARALAGVGDKIGKKIDEFLETGKLQKLEKIRADPRNAAVTELTGVAGIGPAAAAQLVKDGICSIGDLEKHTDKLNHHQKIGLKHYHDFKERIPRSEMQQMEAVLLDTAKTVDADVKVTICGSYRRGAQSSGDVDVLITHPTVTSKSKSAKSANSPLHRFVDALRHKGFITDEISHGEAKFAGVCRLPMQAIKRVNDGDNDIGVGSKTKLAKIDKAEGGSKSMASETKPLTIAVSSSTASAAATSAAASGDCGTIAGTAATDGGSDDRKRGEIPATAGDRQAAATSGDSTAADGIRRFRRLDVRLIPCDQYACGVLYFTGSDMFNKQMRAEALDVGFTLNEYCLRPMGATGMPGEPVDIASERDVFDAIGMDYREPSQRNV